MKSSFLFKFAKATVKIQNDKNHVSISICYFFSLSSNFINLVVDFYFADLGKGKEKENQKVNGVEDVKH